jgi:hypothetical protein
MAHAIWPYCHESFTPSRYRPDQVICSDPLCQGRRRAEYHRKKLQDDALYRAQCRDSQQQWREAHQDYMRTYRQSRRQRLVASADLRSLLTQVKNNVALDLKSCPARVFLVADSNVKKILALAQLIIIGVLLQLGQ